MKRTEILEKLTEILKDTLDLDELELSEDTVADDVDGWDSLAHITIISEVEDAFHIRFPMKNVLTMKNVGEMVDIIEEHTR